jgi:N-acetyl-anhydromuramyl-L-alanine amidase AmpD
VSAPVVHPARIQGHSWSDQLKEPRQGVMLHYDASASDRSSVAWLAGADIKVSYNWIVLDTGNIIPIAPTHARAWHAGWCRSSDPRLQYADANSAFYGVSIAATSGDVAGVETKRSIVAICRSLFIAHRWTAAQAWRIVSHRAHAVYEPGHPKAGQYGRKNDPEGPDLAHPVLSTNEVRGMLAAHGGLS